jgi:hypothetical protein
MRSRSSKRISVWGLVMTGVVLCVILGFVSTLGVPVALRSGEDRKARLPSKTERPAKALAEALALDDDGNPKADGAARGAGQAAAARKESAAASKALDREEARQAVVMAAAAEVLKIEAANRNRSYLREALLEEAGKLALHSDQPWKNLIQVALAYNRAGEKAAATLWFERAQRLAIDPDSSVRSSAALRDVVKGMLAAGMIDESMAVLARIPDPRYRDSAHASVVSVLARRRQFAEATRMASSLFDPKARALAFRSVADAQARYGDLNDALATVFQIPPGRSRDDALSRVSLARAAVGDSAGAAQVVAQITSARSRDLAQVKLAEYEARSGRAGSSETMLALLNDPFLRDESLRRIVEMQVANYKFEDAKASAFRIENTMERALAMESLVKLQVRKGDLVGALSRARSIDVETSRTRALRTVAVAETAATSAAAARSVAFLIEDAWERDVAYRQIAERAAALGRPGDAVETIYEMSFPEERASAFASVARIRARYGAVEPARLLIQDAVREVEQIPQVAKQWKAKGMLATAYAEALDGNAAMSTAAEIGNAGLRDRAYQSLAQKFASLKDIQLAEQSAQAIVREETRERVLADMARTIAGKTRATDALGMLNEFTSREQQVRFLLAVADRI